MSQLRFDWEVQTKPCAPAQPVVELDPETTSTVLALMVRVLLAVTLVVEETANER